MNIKLYEIILEIWKFVSNNIYNRKSVLLSMFLLSIIIIIIIILLSNPNINYY